jgi:hypothetical protein
MRAALRARVGVAVPECAKLAERMQGLTKLLDQRKVQFPWLASAIADFYALGKQNAMPGNWVTRSARRSKPPMWYVREHGRMRRNVEFNFRMMRYRVEYYQKL